MDLLVMTKGRRFGFEFKYSDAPGLARSILAAIEDLRLDRLWVVYFGRQECELNQMASAIPLPASRQTEITL